MGLVIRYEFTDFMRDFRLAIFETDLEGRVVRVAKPITIAFEPLQEGVRCAPTIEFGCDDGRRFIDALKNALIDAGDRPPDESRLSGKLEATQYHLEDMRRLSGLAGCMDGLAKKAVNEHKK